MSSKHTKNNAQDSRRHPYIHTEGGVEYLIIGDERHDLSGDVTLRGLDIESLPSGLHVGGDLELDHGDHDLLIPDTARIDGEIDGPCPYRILPQAEIDAILRSDAADTSGVCAAPDSLAGRQPGA